MRFILLTIFSLLSGFISFSQLGSATLTTDKCAHISTRIDINYGNNVTFDVSTEYNRGVTYYNRGFIEFDLSSIPTNATIISAKLKITNAGGTYVVNPWVAKLLESSWVESTIKASVQPSISSSTSDWETSYTTSGNDIEIDVKNTVQRMVYEAVPNYGWSIEVEDETVAYDSGTSFHSDDASSDEPELIIEYYKPVTLSDVLITHESGTGQSDGSISFSHTALDGSGHTYTWYNSSGTQLQTGSTSTIEELAYGWYGLKIEGNANNETFFYGFLVGTECEEVTITYTPLSDFMDNTLLQSNAVNSNFNNYEAFRSGSWTSSSLWYYAKTLMLERTWMDDEFTINQADITYQNHPSWTHYNNTNSTDNSASLTIVDEYWNPSVVTYNSAPSTGLTALAVSETPVGYSSVSKTLDMTTLWEEWKSDNIVNYGVLFEQDQYSSNYNRQRYASSDYSNASYRPSWTFKLALFEGESCVKRHAMLDYKMDGSYYVMKDGQIRFVFDQEYDAENLTFTIYDNMDEIVFTDANFPAVTTTHGKNYLTLDVSNSSTCLDGKGFFYLEVINSKKERMYLRFFNDFDDCESLPTE